MSKMNLKVDRWKKEIEIVYSKFKDDFKNLKLDKSIFKLKNPKEQYKDFFDSSKVIPCRQDRKDVLLCLYSTFFQPQKHPNEYSSHKAVSLIGPSGCGKTYKLLEMGYHGSKFLTYFVC